MSLQLLFDAAKLRNALQQPEESSSRRHCINTARLVAAFYLGWPLFQLENEEKSYPSLFQWQQLTASSVTGEKIPHEQAAQEIPIEFSSRLPVALFIHLGYDFEAVVYTDFFCDRRSSLILRLVVDNTLELSLTDEYVADFLIKVVDQESRKMEGGRFLCEKLLPAILELDVVLAKSYIRSLELHLVEQIDFLFAQLPLKNSDIKQLPRPPVYNLPEPAASLQGELPILVRINNLLKLVLTSLAQTNCLQGDLKRTIKIFAEPEARLSGGRTILTRLTVIILSLIYRDIFSLAEEEKWKEVPEIAMKYKALIEGEDEQESVQRWHSLADKADLEHVDLFFEFIKANFPSQNNLPPLNNMTRELWYNHICHTEKETHSSRESNDWVSGLFLVERKIHADVWDQIQFIYSDWKGISLPDANLIPLRLYVSPDILSKPLPATPKQIQTAREQLESARSSREDKIFVPRSAILEEYTLKAKEELAKRRMKERRRPHTQRNREPRYMKSTLLALNVQKISETQKALKEAVDEEKEFLNSPLEGYSQRQHSLHTSPCSSSSSSLSSTSTNLRNESIRRDLKKLNEKVESIGTMLIEERQRYEVTKKEILSARTERSLSVASSIPPLPDNYNEIPAAGIPPPPIEKLDFTMLSPSPRPVRPISPLIDDEEEFGEENEEEFESQLSNLSMSTANTLRNIPTAPERTMIRPKTDRLPLLHYKRTCGSSWTVPVVEMTPRGRTQVATSERAVQTANMTLGEMQPMSRADISALYR